MLDRLPLDRMSRRRGDRALLAPDNLLEPPVAQEWKGTVIYDVRHDGQEYTEDTRGRADPGRARDAQ